MSLGNELLELLDMLNTDQREQQFQNQTKTVLSHTQRFHGQTDKTVKQSFLL
jgi:hypothetical protein